jgi:hypothetical protein
MARPYGQDDPSKVTEPPGLRVPLAPIVYARISPGVTLPTYAKRPEGPGVGDGVGSSPPQATRINKARSEKGRTTVSL